jgi:hypothetical protein
MKTPLLLPLLCLIAALSKASPPPPDFAGIAWGASPDAARKAMAEHGAQYDGKQSKGDTLVFTGGKFAGQTAGRWELKFGGGAFYSGIVLLRGEEKAETLYRQMVTEISAKYGSADEKEVAHRLPPHFVLGLGWRSGGAKKPPLHADWVAESNLNGGSAVAISAWARDGKVHVQYMHHSGAPGGSLAPITKARPGDDL